MRDFHDHESLPYLDDEYGLDHRLTPPRDDVRRMGGAT
jgi:hypothetical protein